MGVSNLGHSFTYYLAEKEMVVTNTPIASMKYSGLTCVSAPVFSVVLWFVCCCS